MKNRYNPFNVTGLFLHSLKHQKTSVFLVLSGGIEREEWHEMGFEIYLEFLSRVNLLEHFFDVALHFHIIQKQSPEAFRKKKMFLKISQYSQKNICVAVSFRLATLLKRDSNTGVFLEEHLRIAASELWINPL